VSWVIFEHCASRLQDICNDGLIASPTGSNPQFTANFSTFVK